MATSNDNLIIDSGDTKAILKHVLKTLTTKCEKEAENNSCSIPFEDKQARLLLYTGLSNSKIRELINDTPEESQLTLASRVLILNTFKNIYAHHMLPSYDIIFEETNHNLKYNNNQVIQNTTELIKEMKILGYGLKETLIGSVIVMEDPEVRFERFMYLHKLIKLRNNSVQWPQFVYIDARIVNHALNYDKPYWSTSTPNQDEFVFYHAVSNSGFISGIYSNLNESYKWVRNILLTLLKCPSVIIMGSIYDTPENNSSITRYHSKTEMLLWLINNNIPCNSTMSKPVLYDLITKCGEKQKENCIEAMFRSQGHEVLRLPRHLTDLSITTPLWDAMKESRNRDITIPLNDFRNELVKKILAIPEFKWAEHEAKIVEMEKAIFDIDTTMDNYCDLYKIKK